jgi:hypothetical protein
MKFVETVSTRKLDAFDQLGHTLQVPIIPSLSQLSGTDMEHLFNCKRA